MDLVAKQAKRLDIAIIGYGVAGITAAIGLSKLGHRVTIYEKSFYNFRNKRDLPAQNWQLMYTVSVGAKAMQVIDWLRCKPLFDHHLNSCIGVKD